MDEGLSPQQLFEKYHFLAPNTVLKYYKNYQKEIAKKHNIDVEDLTQYAYEALWEAALLYDPSRGNCKFRSFAITRIKGILKSRVYRDTKQMSFRGIGRTGLNFKHIKENLQFLSFDDKPKNKDEGLTYHELVDSNYQLEGEVVGKLLNNMVEKNYPERIIYILKRRMEGANNSEIGNELGLSRERVRQLLNKIKIELQEELVG